MAGNNSDKLRYEDQFFRKDNPSEAWSRYCGFLNLSINEYCELQNDLLNEQIEKVFNKPQFSSLLGGHMVRNIAEFRATVPLKTYKDYEPLFQNEKCNLMFNDTDFWVHTSATRGTFKKIPWTQQFLEVQRRNIITAAILSAAKESGDVQLFPNRSIMLLMPDLPFVSAHVAAATEKGFTFKAIPPIDSSRELNFNQKIDAALAMGFATDVDFVIAMTSSLMRIAPRFGAVWQDLKRHPGSWLKINPKVAGRLIKSRFNDGRLPVQAWKVKGIICWGTDSTELEQTVESQWGRKPIQLYGSSEGGIMGVQDFTRGPLALFPTGNFYEFIPQEFIKKANPPTVLISEVEDGKVYELVLTNFYGMSLMRYRQGDLVRVTRDKGNPNSVPRISILGRADDTVDVFGIARLSDAVISEALNRTGLSPDNWCVHKEHIGDKVLLNVYLELNHNNGNKDQIRNRLSRSLKSIDRHWAEAVYTMAYNPIEIKAVSPGTFQRLPIPDRDNQLWKLNPPDSILEALKRAE